MGDVKDAEPQPGLRSRVLRGAKDWLTASPAHLGYAIVLLALLLTVPFGGLRATPRAEAAQVAPGTPVDVAPWRISLDKVYWGTDLGGLLGTPTDGRSLVLLTGTLRNTSDRSLDADELDGSVVLDGVPGLSDYFGTRYDGDAVQRAGTFYTLDPYPQDVKAFSPGLDYRFGVLVYSDQAQPPATLTAHLAGKTYRQSSISAGWLWTDPVTTSTVVLPVERVTAAPFPKPPGATP